MTRHGNGVIPGIESSIATSPTPRLTPAFNASLRLSSAAVRSRCSSSANAADHADSLGPLGTDASYPVSRIASTSCSGEVAAGSKATVALWRSRLTVASSTPGVRARARWTRAWQAAQVMPVMGILMLVLII